jgi:hypothetical protein
MRGVLRRRLARLAGLTGPDRPTLPATAEPIAAPISR